VSIVIRLNVRSKLDVQMLYFELKLSGRIRPKVAVGSHSTQKDMKPIDWSLAVGSDLDDLPACVGAEAILYGEEPGVNSRVAVITDID
jgi:hypothetical protein